MSEADMSSCSYLTDFEDPAIQAKDAAIRDLTYEKQHLEDVNKNLQASLESVKQQLKDTLTAVDTSNTVNTQIQALKKQIAEITAKKEQLERQLAIVTENNDNAVSKLSQQVTELTAQRDEALANLSAADDHIAKLKKEKSNLKVENQENAELLKAVTEDFQKVKAQKKKTAQKFVTAAEKLSEVESQNEQLALEIQKLNNEKTTLLSENESLRLKLETASSFNEETEQSLASIEKELQNKVNIIKTLEEQFDAQREEISAFAEDRDKMLTIISTQQKALSQAEATIDSLLKDNACLKTKAKTGAKPVQKPFATIQDFNALMMPFTGDLKTKCQSIMKLPQYQPFQRIQLAFNESAKVIAELSEKLAVETKKADEAKKAYDNFAVDQVKYQEILEALLSELKHLAMNQDLINGSPICKEDLQFVEFINSKLDSIYDIVNREAIKDPKYIQNDFFFTSDMKARKEAVLKLLEPDDSTFSLFCALFLSNVFLENQLSAVTAPLQLINEMTKSGVLKGTQLSDVPRLIESLNTKVNKLSTQNKKLSQNHKKLQAQSMTLIKSENEKKTKISELTLQVDNLQNEIGVLNVKLQVAQNELLLKQNECGNLNQFAQEIRDGVEERTNDQKARTDRLEEALKQKTKECAELGQLLKELEKSIDENTNSQLRRAKRNEEMLLSQLELLQSQVDEYEAEIAQRKKANKKNERALREQYEKSIAELSRNYEEGKKNLEETIDSLKEKAKNAREMSKRLVDNMSDVEKRNAQLQKDNNELNQRLKGVQIEMMTMKNHAQKEKQQQQAQLAAQIMACENRAQQQVAEEKSKCSSKVNSLLQTAQSTIGAFYGIDENEFDEEAYEQTVKNAREDLEKLHYFQQEATKLPRNN